MTALNELSLSQAKNRILAGQLTAEAYWRACQNRIAAREDAVQAFEILDVEKALRRAKNCDAGKETGILSGLPVGIKDIIDTHDFPTACGSPIYQGRRPAADAQCVARLRAEGAIFPGKTVTTEFACFFPGKTRNPRNLDHTTGGSSMGSAAAVADFMLPVALGSQTAASVTRPAAYCGVIGYKATRGGFDLAGVKGLSTTLDSLGFFSRDLADLILLRRAILGGAALSDPSPKNKLRIGFVRTPHWQDLCTASQGLLENTASALLDRGHLVEDLSVGGADGDLTEAHKAVMGFEAARALAVEYDEHADLLSPPLRQLIEQGRAIPRLDYQEALALRETWQTKLLALFQKYDLLLAPSAPGEAPLGHGATGDPLFSRMWTLLGNPSLTLPAGQGSMGLPLGVQLVGPIGGDDQMISDGALVQEAIC